MANTEAKLKERIKELTCLYEVTSILANADASEAEESLKAIAKCLQVAFQYNEDTCIVLNTGMYGIEIQKDYNEYVFIESPVQVFNEPKGTIKVGYPSSKYSLSDFLPEEQRLLNSVCLEVGYLLERIEIKENEALVRRQVERSDRLRLLGELTAGIAHELNTPLANILGFAELLKEQIANSKELTKDLDKIISNAMYSREVVKKLMFFTCEMPQQKRLIDIMPVIKDAISLMRTLFTKNGINHQFISNTKTVKLKIDEIQLTQVIFNLIVNSIYFSPKDSTITVQITDKKDEVTIVIDDEGVGMDPQIGDKIFEPFFTTKPFGEGSGLGLSVVHGIVKSHQGKIEYILKKPRGTMFSINFPKL